MNRSIVIITLAVFALTGSAVMAWAANNGPANIDIFGGKSGKTPFPHAQHQKRIQDCNVCHSVFPQEKDAIKKNESPRHHQA